jgi:hypothetical protein
MISGFSVPGAVSRRDPGTGFQKFLGVPRVLESSGVIEEERS